MKRTFASLLAFLLFAGVQAMASVFPSISWQQALKQASEEGKMVFVAVGNDAGALDDTIQDSETLLELQETHFVNLRITTTDPAYSTLVSNYQLKSFPSYLYLSSEALLLLPVSTTASKLTLLQNAQQALAVKTDKSPVAQMDLYYAQGKISKSSMFDYIQRRTAMGLDNSDIIDDYTKKCSSSEILSSSKLPLLLEQNKCNATGAFVSLLEKDRVKVMSIMKMNEYSYKQRIEEFYTYSFNKMCSNKDEAGLESLITQKIKNTPQEDANIIRNELMAKYYYKTKQPLKLTNFATAYADAIIKYKETSKATDEKIAKGRSQFPSVNINEVYALKLRDAAQYVAESLSNKTSLNAALNWSLMAAEMFNSFSSYETQAYILYKLGKRNEAIHCMEKATSMAPSLDDPQIRNLYARLVKMKRGERIF